MKDISETLEYKGKQYELVCNMNVLQEIQEEYGTIDKWIELTSGKETGEFDVKAVIFAFAAMINEGIDIHNEEVDEKEQLKNLTLKQVGRLVTEVGLSGAVDKIDKLFGASTQGGEDSKNE